MVEITAMLIWVSDINRDKDNNYKVHNFGYDGYDHGNNIMILIITLLMI